MKKYITLMNIGTSLLLQLLTITYGFIIPKIIINSFGNEVNGLVASINQFLSYISLLEGGVTAVIIAKLYKPLVNGDQQKISNIVNTSSRFYKKIGLVFFIYSIIIAIISPFIYVNDEFEYSFIFSLTIILSLNLLIQYMLSLSLKCLLNADKKVWIVSITQSIIIVLNIILSIISVIVYPSIHFLKFLTGITYIIQPIIFNIYVKRNYRIVKSKQIDKDLIKDRWNGFFNNLAYFIHTSTDITILTFLTNLITVSVYSVYSLVTSGLKAIIGAINNGVFPTIGQLYAKEDYDELNKKFDIYEYLYMLTIFIVFSVTFLLITPFVELYVGSNNAEIYYQPLFGVLLCLGTMLDLLKIPHMHLSYSANKFKELTVPCFLEAFINIIFSIILVKRFEILGVAIGTIIAMIYRLFFQLHFTKKIINRSYLKFLKKFFVFLLLMCVVVLLCKEFVYPTEFSVISWLLYGMIYSLIAVIVFVGISLIIFKEEQKEILNKIFYKLHNKGK